MSCAWRRCRFKRKAAMARTPLIALVALLYHASALAGPTASQPTASAPVSTCYVGPIDVTVLRPDNSPAAGIPVGVFGMIWYSKSGEHPPPIDRKRLTDEHGR